MCVRQRARWEAGDGQQRVRVRTGAVVGWSEGVVRSAGADAAGWQRG